MDGDTLNETFFIRPLRTEGEKCSASVGEKGITFCERECLSSNRTDYKEFRAQI